MKHYTVTKSNRDEVIASMAACDQAAEIKLGDETWGIIYQPSNQRGQMTRYANGRGAVCFGGSSDWGDWDGDILTLDETDDDGETVSYNIDGECLVSS